MQSISYSNTKDVRLLIVNDLLKKRKGLVMKKKVKETCFLCQSDSTGVEEIKSEYAGIQTLKIYIRDGNLRLTGGITNVPIRLPFSTDKSVDLVYKINYCPQCGRYIGQDINFEHKRNGCECCEKHKFYNYDQNLINDFEITMVMEYLGAALWFWGEIDAFKRANDNEVIRKLPCFQHWFSYLRYCPMCGKYQKNKDLKKFTLDNLYDYPNLKRSSVV